MSIKDQIPEGTTHFISCGNSTTIRYFKYGHEYKELSVWDTGFKNWVLICNNPCRIDIIIKDYEKHNDGVFRLISELIDLDENAQEFAKLVNNVSRETNGKVVALNTSDIAVGLRNLAASIESGEIKPDLLVLALTDGEMTETRYLGPRAKYSSQCIGLFEMGKLICYENN